jgi:hypothetical protein
MTASARRMLSVLRAWLKNSIASWMLVFLRAPGRVDGDEALAVLLEQHVHGVAGGAGDLADDHAFLPRQLVDQGRLAGVALADDGELHHRLRRPLLVHRGRQGAQDLLEQRIGARAHFGADGEGTAGDAELAKISHLPLQGFALDLVDHQEHRHGGAAQAPGHLVVQGRQTVAGVHQEQDQVGHLDGRGHLALHVGAQVVAVHDADAPRVDGLDPALAEGAHEVRGHGDAVAGHARGRLDDGRRGNRTCG